MTVIDDDRDNRVFGRPELRFGNRAPREPRAWQITSVPSQRRIVVGNDERLAVFFHGTVLERLEIFRQEREAVRVVAEQIAFEQHFGHVAGAVECDPAAVSSLIPNCRSAAASNFPEPGWGMGVSIFQVVAGLIPAATGAIFFRRKRCFKFSRQR